MVPDSVQRARCGWRDTHKVLAATLQAMNERRAVLRHTSFRPPLPIARCYGEASPARAYEFIAATVPPPPIRASGKMFRQAARAQRGIRADFEAARCGMRTESERHDESPRTMQSRG